MSTMADQIQELKDIGEIAELSGWDPAGSKVKKMIEACNNKFSALTSGRFDHSPTCVVAANEFDSIFIPESQKPPPYQPGNLPECNMYNEVAIQTTAGLPHSQQPLRAFFYKVADPTPGHCCGRNQTTWPTCPDAQEIYIQKLHQQASLFSTVSGGKAAPVVGINMTNSSWKTGPFFCDASYYA